MLQVIRHTLEDSIRLIPFLFITYLIMEYLEHKTGEKTQTAIRRAGKWGPLLGSIAGVVPQCGFSAAASGLYAGRVISLGSLLAIYLSTSDEMLPILLSERAEWSLIVRILLLKIVIGMGIGFGIDFVLRSGRLQKWFPVHESGAIHDLCETEHCHCEKGILRSAVIHTLQITGFILLITFLLELLLHYGGENVLSGLWFNRPVIGPVLSGLVGLIPNCGGSIIVTQLYLQGAMDFGTMMAGLLSGTGVGFLILCRVNRSRRENLSILALLYGISVAAGIIL